MTKKKEEKYFKYAFPDVEKDIKLRLKTNIYNVSPKYWMDSSGMKFDNEGKNAITASPTYFKTNPS